jgi:hypothetical protein
MSACMSAAALRRIGALACEQRDRPREHRAVAGADAAREPGHISGRNRRGHDVSSASECPASRQRPRSWPHGASQRARQRSYSTIRSLLLDCFAASGDDKVARSGPELILE